MNRLPFRPRKIALAVALASLYGPAAIASEIGYAMNPVNLQTVADHNGDGPATLIYPDAAKTAGTERGFVVIDAEEGVVEPGMGAYTVGFNADNLDFDGCIMSSKGEPDSSWTSTDSCKLPPDSGKRFKLRATSLNEPMDIVFDLTETARANLYNVYGKFSNYTGTNAQGFTVQVGTGVGADFKVLPGVELAGGEEELGKFPGGLFGGSAVEGLPFFSPNPETFEATADSLTTLHTRTTAGLPQTATGMPGKVQDLFGSWLPRSAVPDSWTYDDDGKPWTDNKIVAYLPLAAGSAWTTYKKSWTGTQITLKKGSRTDVITLADYGSLDPTRSEYNDPSAADPKFADVKALTKKINTDLGTNYKVQDVVHALTRILKIDPAPVDAAVLADWATKPPTVRDPSSNHDLVATWNSATEEYDVDPAYQAELGGATVSMEEMEDLVDVQKRFEVHPGYTKDVIEDLANVNVSYAIKVGANVAGPLTMRVWVTDNSAVVTPPADAGTGGAGGSTGGDTGSTGGGGGCAIGGSGTPDPTLPALLALGLGMLGWRRLRAARKD